MATGVVLPPDIGVTGWPPEREISSVRAASTASGVPSLSSMARQVHAKANDEALQHPRLPSFSNFLSGAGRPDITLDPASRSPARGRPASSHQNDASASLPPGQHHHAVPANPARNSERDPLPDAASRPHGAFHPPVAGSLFTPYAVSNPLPRPLPHPMPFGQGPSHGPVYGRNVVGEEIIPGKGPCYIYDDGTIVQKVINGDLVNPKWGTTKAGKPRKRLGQACNTCREKKIKCDPSVPKCAQCQKFGRECKFESASRSSHKSPSSQPTTFSPASADAGPDGLRARRGSTASEPSGARASSKSSMNVENLLSPSSTDDLATDDGPESSRPAKKPKLAQSPRDASDPYALDGLQTAARSASTVPSTGSPAAAARSSFGCHVDPYERDPELTLYYLDKYFCEIDRRAYCLVPRPAFLHWVTSCTTKSIFDKMLLYAMMAIGAVRARRPGAGAHRAIFANIAEEEMAQCSGVFNLQVVQTRLVLAMFSFTQGEHNKAWDLCGSTLRAAYGMQFNTEEGVNKFGPPEKFDYDLDKATLIESRRRTFWSAYLMDAFSPGSSATLTTVNRSDCPLRLPCPEDMFEKGIIPVVPFDFEASHADDGALNFGLMAFLIQLATIFSDVLNNINRSKTQAADKYKVSFRIFYEDVKRRLQIWDKIFRKYLRESSADPGTDPASGLHIVYHFCAMMLHRYIRHADLDPTLVEMHVQEAYRHARRTLEIIQRLSNNEDKDSSHLRFGASSPLNGFVIITAVDIITATGTMSDLLDDQSRTMGLVSGGIEALESLMDQWPSVRQHHDLITQRVGILLNASTSGATRGNMAFYFSKPMQSLFGPEQDIVYGLPRLQYLRALGWGDRITSEADLYQVDAFG